MKKRWWHRGAAFIPGMLLLCFATAAAAFRLPDSDQRKCYQDISPYTEISCPGSGQDGEYLHNPLSYTDRIPGTEIDYNTGLMWQQEDTHHTYNWYRASGTYHATYNPGSESVCGSLRLGGWTDWRLPSKKELMSIVDYSIPHPGPTIATGYFKNTKTASDYWSSTTFSEVSLGAGSLDFEGGYINEGLKTNMDYVRCVRGGQFDSQALSDNGDGTVTDGRTRLTWQQGEPGAMVWGSALGYCKGLDLGGRSDWRLPNFKELQSLTDDTRYNPAIDTTFFPGAVADFYWSSTTEAYSPGEAWPMHFRGAYICSYDYYAKSYAYYVRCVRGGPSGSPVLDPIGDKTVTEGNQLEITLTATDPDGDSLTYSAFNLPAGAIFDLATGTFTWTPGYTRAGIYHVSFTVDDGFLTDSEDVTITVLDEPGIVFKLPDSDQRKCYQVVSPYAEISCARTGQDGAYIITPLNYADNGDGTVSDNNTGLEWQQQDDNAVYNWYQASGTYDATYNPDTANVCGSLALGGHADWRLPSEKELMTIVDYAIPYPGPAIATDYFTNTKASGYWSSITNAYDPEVAWGVSFDAGFVLYVPKFWTFIVRCVRGRQFEQSFIDNGNGTVTDGRTSLTWQQGEPGAMSWGSALGYCEGLDLGGETDWRLPNIKELESLTDDTLFIPAIDTTFFPSAYSYNYWSSTTTAMYPGFAWYVDFDEGHVSQADKNAFSYGCVRCVRGGPSGSFGTPVLDPIGNKTVAEGNQLAFTLNATDPDGDPLIYSAFNIPAGAIFDPVTATFTWTPSYVQAGTYSGIRFEVSDGYLTDAEEITITVTNINRPPVLDSIGGKTVAEVNQLKFTLSATDPEGDTLIYSASGLPSGATFDPATRTFTWTPGYDQAGTYSGVRFEVSDGNLTDAEEITIIVTNVNRPPVLDSIGGKTVAEQQLLTFTITGSDPDSDELTFSASGLPPGANFDPSTATFTWTPGYDQARTYILIRFEVSDGNMNDTENVYITVTDLNRPPVIDSISDQTVAEGQLLHFKITGSDPDLDNGLTWSASGLPVGASWDYPWFTWTPSYDQAGDYSITINVTDNGTPELSDSETFTVTVQETYDIKGKVRTYLGAPLRRGYISLTPDGGLTVVARTDSLGRYAITGLLPNTLYTIRPSKLGWYFQPRKKVVLLGTASLLKQNFTAFPR